MTRVTTIRGGAIPEVTPMSDTMQQVMIRMPSDMYDDVKRLAESEDRTVAAEIRRAVRHHLEKGLQPV